VSLLAVADDLSHVRDAELVVLENLFNDMETLKTDILPIKAAVTAQAERLEEAGETVPISVKELSEQRTSIRNVARVPQFNKVDHHTGRTPMERFVLNAEGRIDEALEWMKETKRKFVELLDFFGEDPGMASNDFFGTMNRFLAFFAKAVEQVNQEERLRVRLHVRCVCQSKLHRSFLIYS
jgi:Formin Homology 2 Domain